MVNWAVILTIYLPQITTALEAAIVKALENFLRIQLHSAGKIEQKPAHLCSFAMLIG